MTPLPHRRPQGRPPRPDSSPRCRAARPRVDALEGRSLLTTLTGSVQHKRTKRDVGEIAWAIPGLQDVQNNVSITSRRRARAAGREAEAPAGVAARKQG